MKRLSYLDWLRGLAVLIMMLWHSMDAWTAPSARQSAAFDFIIVIGGWAAPLFLFLAGVSIGLAGSAARARGAERGAASWRLQKRGWQVFLLAHLFRLQAFLLNPSALWSSLLKPDILNILGLGMVAVAWCWGRAATRARQVAWLLGPAAAIVLLTPGSRSWWWPTVFRTFAPRLEAYIRPVSGMGVFSVFPWVAFVFVGAFSGVHIAARNTEGAERRLQIELSVTALLVVAASIVGMRLPPLSRDSSFWTTSASFFLLRAGAMTLAIPAAWRWMARSTARHWSALILFGRTSLFVYWVHVELAYGIFTYPLHGALSLRVALLGFIALTVSMLGLATLWIRRRQEAANLERQSPSFGRTAERGAKPFISPRRSSSGSN